MFSIVSRQRLTQSIGRAARVAAAAVVISIAVPATTALACDRWVATSGSDSGAGSAADPFRSIQRAADVSTAGQTICVAAGVYSERVQITRSGNAQTPIRFEADGTVRTRGFTVMANHVGIDGFEITDTLNSWRDGVGIYIHGTGVEVTDNYLYETRYDGIYCEKYAPYCDDALISGNVVTYATGSGIHVFGTGARVEGNDISHSLVGSDDADGVRFFGRQHELVNNWIHDITESEAPGAHTDCFQTFDNDQEPTTDILIAGNVCERVDHQCLIASAVSQGESQDLRFESNVCDNQGSQAVLVWNFRDVEIVGNTFGPDILYQGIMAMEGATGVSVLGNIFYGTYLYYYFDQSSTAGSLMDGNLKYPASFEQWSEPNGLWNVDPQFVNASGRNYRLREGSPAIDANVRTPTFAFDAAGGARILDGDCDGGSNTDIGAYELESTSCPGTQTKVLTVRVLGDGGGMVASSPAGISCGSDCSEGYLEGTVVGLTPTAATGSVFSGWSGAADCSDGSVTMTVNRQCDAVFDAAPGVSYSLAVTKSGTGSGAVTSSPAGINCGNDCSQSYAQGTIVQLTPSPAAGSVFAGWSGGADCSDSSVTMNGNKQCNATFNSAPVSYSLTVTKSGTGSGAVTSSPAGINCGNDCSQSYAQGTIVQLTPSPAAGSVFAGWSGGADCSDSSVTMNGNKQCNATFNSAAVSHRLSVSFGGPGRGSVTASPGGIDCGNDCSEIYPAGTRVVLTATPNIGSVLRDIRGNSDCADGVVVIESAVNCQFRFFKGKRIRAKISGSRSGESGWVRSNPAGIDCRDDCNAVFGENATVELLATPDPGFRLVEWKGHPDCKDGRITGKKSKNCRAVFAPTGQQPTTLFADGFEGGDTYWWTEDGD